MKTKMLSLLIVVLFLQAIPMNANSGDYFSQIKTHAYNTKSWLGEQRKKHLPRKRIVAITAVAATTAATALVVYLCRGQDSYFSINGKLEKLPTIQKLPTINEDQ